MIRLFILSLFASAATWAQAVEFSVVVQGIPRPVSMSFPADFRLADSHSARERRERLLNFYRLNPAYKGHYDEILLRDWSSPDRLPSIVIGILGTTERHQGRITTKDWQAIRQEFATANKKRVTEIRDQYRPPIEANSPIPMKTTEELIWFEQQADPNSVIVLAHLRSELDGKLETVFSARKLLYHNGYLLFANVVVDSSRPNALKTIKEYLAALSIKSV